MLKRADFAPFSGDREDATSNLRPLTMRSSSSTWLRRILVVVQDWVKVSPWTLSDHFPSMSPLITSVLASRAPWTLKETLEGVLVLISMDAPLNGYSLVSKSFDDFPRSW